MQGGWSSIWIFKNFRYPTSISLSEAIRGDHPSRSVFLERFLDIFLWDTSFEDTAAWTGEQFFMQVASEPQFKSQYESDHETQYESLSSDFDLSLSKRRRLLLLSLKNYVGCQTWLNCLVGIGAGCPTQPKCAFWYDEADSCLVESPV